MNLPLQNRSHLHLSIPNQKQLFAFFFVLIFFFFCIQYRKVDFKKSDLWIKKIATSKS